MADLIISGPPIKLHNGWARMPFVGMKSHYWREDRHTLPAQISERGRTRFYVASCGALAVTDDRAPAFNEGNWPRCKRCQQKEAACDS